MGLRARTGYACIAGGQSLATGTSCPTPTQFDDTLWRSSAHEPGVTHDSEISQMRNKRTSLIAAAVTCGVAVVVLSSLALANGRRNGSQLLLPRQARLSRQSSARAMSGEPGSPTSTMTIDGNYLPPQPQRFGGTIGLEVKDSKPWWPARVVPPKGAPNILLIMTDDAGYGVAGTFGGVIPTPAL